nr:MAG TPA: hypothetical protein [Caudoviricetes sp.]
MQQQSSLIVAKIAMWREWVRVQPGSLASS